MTAVNDETEKELWGPPRSRTVTWHDPGPGTARGLAMAGIDYLKALIAGELPPPPIAALMQFDWSRQSPARWCSPADRTGRCTTRTAAYTAAWSAPCSTPLPGWQCTARFLPARGTPRSR